MWPSQFLYCIRQFSRDQNPTRRILTNAVSNDESRPNTFLLYSGPVYYHLSNLASGILSGNKIAWRRPDHEQVRAGKMPAPDTHIRDFPYVSIIENPSANAADLVWSLGWNDLLEKEMATHSSILAWEIPWTEGPGGLQSMGNKEPNRTEPLNNTITHITTNTT